MSDQTRNELLGGIQLVHGPMDGTLLWDNVSATELLFPVQGQGEAVYKSSDAIKTGGYREFVFAGMRDQQICKVCDGGPGNHGVCLCGIHKYEQTYPNAGK